MAKYGILDIHADTDCDFKCRNYAFSSEEEAQKFALILAERNARYFTKVTGREYRVETLGKYKTQCVSSHQPVDKYAHMIGTWSSETLDEGDVLFDKASSVDDTEIAAFQKEFRLALNGGFGEALDTGFFEIDDDDAYERLIRLYCRRGIVHAVKKRAAKNLDSFGLIDGFRCMVEKFFEYSIRHRFPDSDECSGDDLEVWQYRFGDELRDLKDAAAHLAGAQVYEDLGKPEDAYEEFENAIEHLHHHAVLIQIAKSRAAWTPAEIGE